MVRRFVQSEVRGRGTGYRRTAAVLGALPFTTNTAWLMVRRCWSEAPARLDEVGQASSRRADRDTGTRWPPSMGSGKPPTGRPVCGARRRPTIPYEDDPGYGNLQKCAADNLVRATPSDEHFEFNYRAPLGVGRRDRPAPTKTSCRSSRVSLFQGLRCSWTGWPPMARLRAAGWRVL